MLTGRLCGLTMAPRLVRTKCHDYSGLSTMIRQMMILLRRNPVPFMAAAFIIGILEHAWAQENAPAVQQRLEAVAAAAHASPVVTIPAGEFLMGTARSNALSLGLEGPYDDTEQPQRRIWLDDFQIDRDEVSVGEYVGWLLSERRPIDRELHKLLDHVITVHGVSPERVARWPALYVTWPEASAFCHRHGRRLPTEAEWEKAARGTETNVFPWGAAAPTSSRAVFGHYHVHEVPILALVDAGGDGQSPYGMNHMAGNAAEWVNDWYGIDYYATMPDRNPGGPKDGRYKVVRGGSWKSSPASLRSATRSGAIPAQRAATIGFRCANPLDR